MEGKCRFDMYGFCNYHFAMSITIDQAGRIVIPKKMREKLNFENGSVLQCDVEHDSIRLKLADTRCRLTSKNGILVAEGDAPAVGLLPSATTSHSVVRVAATKTAGRWKYPQQTHRGCKATQR